jgi:plasmid stability protein
MSSPEPRRYPLLGLVAYLLVPGERRVRAARHFRRAGVEVLRGVRALVTPERKPEEEASGQRERIEIE